MLSIVVDVGLTKLQFSILLMVKIHADAKQDTLDNCIRTQVVLSVQRENLPKLQRLHAKNARTDKRPPPDRAVVSIVLPASIL